MAASRRLAILMVIALVLAMAIGGITWTSFYRVAVDQQQRRQTEIARSQALMMEAMDVFVGSHPPAVHHDAFAEATLAEARDVHARAMLPDDTKGFLLVGRADPGGLAMVARAGAPWTAAGQPMDAMDEEPALADPLRRALAGQAGTMVSTTRDGRDLLVAFEPVGDQGLGVIAGIEMAEITRPFLRAISAIAMTAFFVIAVAGVLFLGVGSEMIRSVRDSEARLRAVAAALPDRLYVLDRDGRFLQVLSGAGKIPTTAAPGRWLADVLPGPVATRFVAAIRQTEATRQTQILEYDHEVDGVRHWFDARMAPLDGPDGSTAASVAGSGAVVAVVREITKRKEAEQSLWQAQKMEVLGQLTGGIAHDFNNILAVVLANLEFVDEQMDDGDQRRRLLQRALDGVHRGARLTERLLTFSRRHLVEAAPLDVADVVGDMIDMLRRTIESTITLEPTLAVAPPLVLADRGQLENALLNLVVNARDAMPHGGRLRIEVGVGDGAPHDDGPAGQQVVVTVADTGTGMDQAVLQRVFEPFFTTKRAGQGTGLGLSMVYAFARQSGGAIDIDSVPGEGTTVRLTLPAAAEPGTISSEYVAGEG